MGMRLAKVAHEPDVLLMRCDSCAFQRGLASGGVWPEKAMAEGTVDGVQVGCFPDLCAALAAAHRDQINTL